MRALAAGAVGGEIALVVVAYSSSELQSLLFVPNW